MFALPANERHTAFATITRPDVARADKRRVDAVLNGEPLKLVFSIAKAQGDGKRCVFVVKLTTSIYPAHVEQPENCRRRIAQLGYRLSTIGNVPKRATELWIH
jgi:hypothetical protein